ncbi:MAG: DEAD/DEAH box helicase family protein [Treponema sp.]|jgi:ERCC4-related helicase|nr:DEAD/DEAH box helicase family protein [Treponema sp.]
MNYRTLSGKVMEYMHFCTVALSKWLEIMLPLALGKDWWNTGVIGKLSYNQQEIVNRKCINSLAGLDLSALLRVADRNWYAIQNRYFLRYSDRFIISKMFSVRNNWAHNPSIPVSLDEIIKDLLIIRDFLIFVDTGRENLKEYEKLLAEVKANGISDIETNILIEKIPKILEKTATTTEIEKDSIVRLISDTNSVGMVMSIDKIGSTLQYTVFINGKTKTYFEGQIEIVPQTETSGYSNLTDVQRKLTAHQIKKPSSESLYSLNAARIDFVPYQFRPALKLIKSDTPRLLIADSVGVGKTIEAGLILKEMQARTSLDTILIICPKPLVAERKWELEMKRFDEDFIPVNGETLRQIIKDAERDGEWPDQYKRLIIPYSLLTEDLLEGKNIRGQRSHGLRVLDPVPFFDMIIVDEAHHIRNRTTQAYKVVEFFCQNANAALFLTATPLQLGNDDLFTLLNVLFPDTVIDKSTFNAMAAPNSYINSAIHNLRVINHEKDALEQIEQAITTDWGRNVIAPNPIYKEVVTTLKNDEITREQRVKLISDIESLHSFANMINRTRRQDIEDFCIRRAYTLESDFTADQRKLYDALLSFVAEILSLLYPSITLKFLMCTLYRQAASCIFGLAPFIRNITDRHLSNLSDEYDFSDETEPDDHDLDAIFDIFNKESQELIKLAENLPAEDTKFDKFAEIIVERQNRENNKMIVFTTFRHTISYLSRRIKEISGVRAAYVDGTVVDEERYNLHERFALPKDDPEALDILLFTEVGSEGLDYQFCNTIVNYDLPWNPMRVEQRIGRIDRRGQKSDVAHIYNCVTKDTIDEEIYERCLLRIGIFEHSIGDCSDILGELVRSINDLVLDPELTEKERLDKLEQLADNEVRKVQEMRRLEDDEKQMFGVDISSFTEDVDKADNPWLSSLSLHRLVAGYLEKQLGTGNVRLTEDKLKLSQAEKAILIKDYEKLDNTVQDAIWPKYLRSSSSTCKIAFDQDAAKDTKCLFITPMHPLVRQAANVYFSDEISQIKIIIETNSTDIAPGKYPFQFYTWEYTGGKSRTLLLPVCTDGEVQNELPSIMQNAISYDTNIDSYEFEWEKLAETHLKLWQEESSKFKNDADSLYRFKIESLTKSVTARKNIALQQIREISDEKVIRMREAKIARLDVEITNKKQKLEETAKLADIHTALLVNGILIVKEEN